MTKYMSIIHLPWSVKLIYGLTSDNVPIFGTRRKSYIVLMGIIQFLALISVYFINNGEHQASAMTVAICLTFATFSEAFVNVVSDAIMCVQARKDPDHGSQDLIAYSWLATGVGGAIGSLMSGILTQYYHPKYSFLIYSFMGLIISYIGAQLSEDSEEDEAQNESQLSSLIASSS